MSVLIPPSPLHKVCHRYSVESAAGQLEMGRLWPATVKAETLAKVRALPTYDQATDTVIVCRYAVAAQGTARNQHTPNRTRTGAQQ